MQNGYVICTTGLTAVLCLAKDRQGFVMVPVEGPSALNKAMCLHDLTEAKNVLKRIKNSAEFEDVVEDVEICNVARLYNNFF